MNKRAVVNVATGEFYCKMQERLIESFSKSVDRLINIRHVKDDGKFIGEPMSGTLVKTTGIDLIAFRDCLPFGSRSHSESPYGFKVHAIKAAYEMGYTSILWLDSPAYAVKEDISPIFDKIEKEGYYVMSHVDPLENWVGEFVLNQFAMRRDLLDGHNLPSGSCYGFDLSRPNIKTLFDFFYGYERKGFFNSEKISETGWHRHDEAVLAMLLIRDGYPVFTFDPLFQSDSPECVIKSGGL